MTAQEAHQMLTTLAVNYRGTLEEHKALQQALELLKPVVKDEPKP